MALHADFPIVEGLYQMTNEWSLNLPSQFNRRIDDGDLVIWRPGFTVWVAIWGNDNNESIESRLNHLKSTRSPDAASVNESKNGSISYYSYRLAEPSDESRVPALYCYAFSENSEVQMALHFDNENDIQTATEICNSLHFSKKS